MKNIIIFGTGEFGKDSFHFYQLEDNINIIAFSDNDITKHNTILLDTKIINPKDILTIKFDEIVIASSFDDEIYQQLIGFGIDTNKINILNLNEIKIQLSQGDKLALAQQLMIDIANLFNKEDINYHIDHGTLLGVVRDNSLMPWDIDVDFAVLSEDKDIIIKTLEKFLTTYSIKYCQNNNWKCSLHNCKITLDKNEEYLPMVIKVFNDCDDITSNSFFVDIELKYNYNDNLYWMVGSRKLSIPKEICFPVSSITFKDRLIKAPKETNQYLKHLYGNWQKHE